MSTVNLVFIDKNLHNLTEICNSQISNFSKGSISSTNKAE